MRCELFVHCLLLDTGSMNDFDEKTELLLPEVLGSCSFYMIQLQYLVLGHSLLLPGCHLMWEPMTNPLRKGSRPTHDFNLRSFSWCDKGGRITILTKVSAAYPVGFGLLKIPVNVNSGCNRIGECYPKREVWVVSNKDRCLFTKRGLWVVTWILTFAFVLLTFICWPRILIGTVYVELNQLWGNSCLLRTVNIFFYLFSSQICGYV